MAAIGGLSLLLAVSGACGLARVCQAAPPEVAPISKTEPAANDGGSLWTGLSLHGVPIDPVAAGLNYAEQISHNLDLAFHPAIGPHDPFRIFSRTLQPGVVPHIPEVGSQIRGVVSHMPVVVPRTDLDPRMLVEIRNSSLDAKIIVPAPTLEPMNLIDAREPAK